MTSKPQGPTLSKPARNATCMVMHPSAGRAGGFIPAPDGVCLSNFPYISNCHTSKPQDSGGYRQDRPANTVQDAQCIAMHPEGQR